MGRGADGTALDLALDEVVRSAPSLSDYELRREKQLERQELLVELNAQLSQGEGRRFRLTGERRQTLLEALDDAAINEMRGEELAELFIFLLRLLHERPLEEMKEQNRFLPSLDQLYFVSGAAERLTPYVALVPGYETREWVPRRGANGINGGGGHYEVKRFSESLHLRAEPDANVALCGKSLGGASAFYYSGGFGREQGHACIRCRGLAERDSELSEAVRHEAAMSRHGNRPVSEAEEEKLAEQVFAAALPELRRALKKQRSTLDSYRRAIQRSERRLLAETAIASLYQLDPEERRARIFSLPPASPGSFATIRGIWPQLEGDLDRFSAFLPETEWRWPDQQRAAELLIAACEQNSETTARYRFLLSLAKEAYPRGYKAYLRDKEPSVMKAWAPDPAKR